MDGETDEGRREKGGERGGKRRSFSGITFNVRYHLVF